ncbi:hypothetical protein Dimus_033115 [Dionaea muscipula]
MHGKEPSLRNAELGENLPWPSSGEPPMQTPSLGEKPSGHAWKLEIELTIPVSMKPPILGMPSSRIGDCRAQDPHFPMNMPTTAQGAISELTSSWDNTTVAAAEHEKEEKAENTLWPSFSSSKLLTSDEQLGVRLPSSSQDRRQPMHGSSRTSMHGHAGLSRTGAIRRRRSQRYRDQDIAFPLHKTEHRDKKYKAMINAWPSSCFNHHASSMSPRKKSYIGILPPETEHQY